MGTTLQHGIFLPAEGERNCYAGLASNWTILDGVVGGYSAHAANTTIHVTAADKEAWNGKADASALTAHTGDTTIHVTAADKEAWNGKADASALTAHTGNTTIHVTAADKQTWDGKADASALTAHTGNTTIHVTAADKQTWDGKADASALTAHTGNTTIHVTAEDKTKWDAVTGKADASALTAHTGNTTIHVTAEDKTKWDAVTGKADDTDTVHKSGAETITGVKTFSAIPIFATFDGIRFRCAHNSGAYITFRNANQANPGSIILSANDGTTVTSLHLVDKTLIPYNTNDVDLGTTSRKWKSLNGINPGALSLPDLTAGVDISAYITDLTGASNINKFTPTADGWISIGLSSADFIEIYIPASLMGGSFTKSTTNNYGQAFMPVMANKEVRIALKGTLIGWAKFYPCRGNI